MANGGFLTQLREIQHSSRIELYKHLSIISVAGLGFNLVWIRGEVLQNWPFLSYDTLQFRLWVACCGSFLLTIIGILVVFLFISRQAQAMGDLQSPRLREEVRNRLEIKNRRIRMWLKGVNLSIFCTFTIAISLTIVLLLPFEFAFLEEVLQ